jgi:hypothetical protein
VSAPDATRLWQTYKEAGRPIPRFSDDDYIDFCVTEALRLRVAKEENKRRKEDERKQWKETRRKELAKKQNG